MVAYVVEQLDDVVVDGGSPLDGMDLMSPFVWREGGAYRMMLRGVPRPLTPDKPTGVIAAAHSQDGLHFTVEPKLAIVPSGDEVASDDGGCEDPTVLVDDNGYTVFYTGVDAAHEQGCLMVASGPSLDGLVKREVAFKARPGYGNIKEATLVQTSKGLWRLFYDTHTKTPRASAWPGSIRRVGRGNPCRSRSRSGKTAGTTGTCRPDRSCNCPGPTR